MRSLLIAFWKYTFTYIYLRDAVTLRASLIYRYSVDLRFICIKNIILLEYYYEDSEFFLITEVI